MSTLYSSQNRSRKCPACAQRFDMKDMAEIWLWVKVKELL